MAKGLDKAFLEQCLNDGMSLPEIGKLVGRPPGTVGYWVKRHGLVANGSRKFRPGKGIKRADLEPLVARGLTLGQIAKELEVGIQTVRYWIDRYGLPHPKEIRAERRAELLRSGETRGTFKCRHHGETEFFADSAGSWRCRQCRQEAVSRRRRRVKRVLVEEAGGGCAICGYDRAIGALHFHHLDPVDEAVSGDFERSHDRVEPGAGGSCQVRAPLRELPCRGGSRRDRVAAAARPHH